jgi:hypothetical protein
MSIPSEAMDELREVCAGAQEMPEGEITYVSLPGLKISEHEILNGLLCPQQHGGYTTRLFLSKPIHEKGANWSVHTILSRTWHTWSWNNVPANQRPVEILAQHLRALR